MLDMHCRKATRDNDSLEWEALQDLQGAMSGRGTHPTKLTFVSEPAAQQHSLSFELLLAVLIVGETGVLDLQAEDSIYNGTWLHRVLFLALELQHTALR